MLRNLIAAVVVGLALLATPSFAQEDQCLTRAAIHESFAAIAAESGDDLQLVSSRDFDDGSGVDFFWKGDETVLAVIYDPRGCLAKAEVITLGEFRELTGIVLATT